ncbi:MAG: hypothetical protein IKN53_00845 [Oscillibacter sp.]|nr:hypothetical protein [Oscillibacter sp.]
MKKWFALLLTLALALSLASCGAQKAPQDNAEESAAPEDAEEEWDDWEEKEYEVMDFTEVEGVTHYTYKHSESNYDYGDYHYSDYEDETYGYLDGCTDPAFIRSIAANQYSYENVYTYTEDGKMLTWAYRDADGREDLTEYTYENERLVKTVETQDGETTVTISHYTDSGDFLASEQYRDGSDEPCSTEVWEYDGGTLLRMITESDDGSKSILEYEYADGLDQLETGYTNTYVDPDGTEHVSSTVFEHDAAGRVIRETDTDADGAVTTYEREYDAQDREIKCVYTGTDDYGYTCETTYDGNGNVLTSVTTYLDGTVETEENTYDAEGRPVREYTVNASEGGKSEYITTYVYE